MKRITIIGHFGFKENLLNGQTIKTKTISSELEKKYGKKIVKKIDTRGNFFKRCFSFAKIVLSFFSSSDIIFLPAQRGIKTLGPLLVFINNIFKRKLHYITIGGWLFDVVSTDLKLLSRLKKINYIYVETNYIFKQLETLGLNNLYLMPNCKKLARVSLDDLTINNGPVFRFCTFSRVSKDKGIEDAVLAIKKANIECPNRTFLLDVYGEVSDQEKNWFDTFSNCFDDHILYCGKIEFDKSTSVLSKYDALLFPTFYEGEGFPGTIVDAFSSGLPVLASNWKSNSEIINEKTGLLFEPQNVFELTTLIISITNNPKKLFGMKKECLVEAKKYESNCVLRTLYNNIKQNEDLL